MPRSMTGFGAAHAVESGCRFGVEVRSVNGRFLKCVCRTPDELHGIEPDIEGAVGKILRRGSVTVTVRMVDESAQAARPVNVAALTQYVEQLTPVASQLGQPIDVASLMTLPGVLSPESPDTDRLDQVRGIVLDLVRRACGDVDAMRKHEGGALARELESHLGHIQERLEAIGTRAPAVVDAYQTRLRQRMAALLADVGAEVREEDMLREVAVFAERSDITEEVARLGAHLNQFRDLLASQDALVGRTLDFLAQEMLRGSKCLDSEVGRAIVEVKGAVDRVKEQVQNLE